MSMDICDNFIVLLKELAKSLRLFQQQKAFCEGITFNQYFILDAIVSQDRFLPLNQLHEYLGVEKSTTTRLIAPLVSLDYVQKQPSSDDSRAHILIITDKGLLAYQTFKKCLKEQLNIIIKSINLDEKLVLTGLSAFVNSVNACCGKKSYC